VVPAGAATAVVSNFDQERDKRRWLDGRLRILSCFVFGGPSALTFPCMLPLFRESQNPYNVIVVCTFPGNQRYRQVRNETRDRIVGILVPG
jgi:hypothetical protein